MIHVIGKNLKPNYFAYLFLKGDILQSIGVLIAAIFIYCFGGDNGQYNYWHLADPICTFIFSIIVVFTTVSVCRDCVRVLMEGTPVEIEIEKFKKQLLSIKHVIEIHDLHIWSLSRGKPSLSCHIFAEENPKKVLKESTRLCRAAGIYHSTIQIEDW